MDIKQFHQFIVRPSLQAIGLQSLAAERLLVGTALVESNLHYVQQIRGCAMGFYQMEPATHDDIWNNFLEYRQPLAKRVKSLLFDGMTQHEQLRTNTAYATAMARVHYFRVKEALPGDAQGMALYHKEYYNTHEGKTDVSESIEYFKQVMRVI